MSEAAYKRAVAEGERLAALSKLTGVERGLALCDAWMEQDEAALSAIFGEDHDGWWDFACRDALVAAYRELAQAQRVEDSRAPGKRQP